MLGVYNYTVILTYIGMLTGLAGIGLALRGGLPWALLCLLLAGLFDMFDGTIASTKKDRTPQERRFGVQIDSLSDLVCFGVLPAAIVFAAAHGRAVAAVVSGLYALCALIRLAWFNVDEEERQDTAAGGRTQYLGLPVTTVALFLPTLLGVARLASWHLGFWPSWPWRFCFPSRWPSPASPESWSCSSSAAPSLLSSCWG